ncbi:beta-1,6-N-acetylglucosaminyltransferase [Chitinophaga polysaccharea]|uniref:beta-1,6-N-acetylglucosaminyltransferase n=1 Tax=Chitinophaga TaxID=79328 RepID=UPI0014556CF6|nr:MULTISPECIES: beta-1,6-N-acetylglucosaminyltransferase [Chitinophaga]NLR62650.1 beta-1,6-N-acetylglucosaminyltransferase [Chitinophaga polysaccharea]NLU91460.1 beta-1,6-N-acetylglucosaminyltransferase [Chitinophaga sp. Ak27]
MKIFYLILAHHQLNRLDKLITALNHEHAQFILHVDKKADIREIKELRKKYQGKVVLIRRRFDIAWGGYNMVKATLSLIRKAVKESEKGYLVLLSGEDFPLKSADHIYDGLHENYGVEYIEHFALPDPRWSMNGGLDRINYYWHIDELKREGSFTTYIDQQQTGHVRPYFEGIIPCGGSQWWCITFECAKYILRFLKTNKIYEEYYKYCYIPDEMFFQTLILNSPFKHNVMNNNLRYIDWESGPQFPKELTMHDLDSLVKSGKFWARKFKDAVGVTVISEIEKDLGLPL